MISMFRVESACWCDLLLYADDARPLQRLYATLQINNAGKLSSRVRVLIHTHSGGLIARPWCKHDVWEWCYWFLRVLCILRVFMKRLRLVSSHWYWLAPLRSIASGWILMLIVAPVSLVQRLWRVRVELLEQCLIYLQQCLLIVHEQVQDYEPILCCEILDLNLFPLQLT